MDDELQSFGLGPRFDSRAFKTNPAISMIEYDLSRLLGGWPKAEGVQFAITENQTPRAVALLNKRYVVVTFGLLDQICKLAAAAITQGVFVAFRDASPQWRPSEYPPNRLDAQLGQQPFHWDPEQLPWLVDFERQMIFVHMVISMSRFVFFHELGHIILGHGRSSSDPGFQVMQMADGPHEPVPLQTSLHELQAKELAADTYALDAILCLNEFEFEADREDEGGRLLQTHLLTRKTLRARWALMTCYFMFLLLDRYDHTPATVAMRSHPPTAFRLRYLFGHALVRNAFDLTETETADEVLNVIALSDAVVAIALDRPPEPQWLRQHSAEYDALFMSLYALVPQWGQMPD